MHKLLILTQITNKTKDNILSPVQGRNYGRGKERAFFFSDIIPGYALLEYLLQWTQKSFILNWQRGALWYINFVDIDRHRESLSKYCYDLSKIIVTIAVVNPFLSKACKVIDLVIGIIVGILFLIIAILIEKGGKSWLPLPLDFWF